MASQPRCSCYVVGGGGASTREWTLGSAQRVFATDREQRTHVITQWYTLSSTRSGDVGRELMMSVLCAHPLDVALTPHTRHVADIAIRLWARTHAGIPPALALS